MVGKMSSDHRKALQDQALSALYWPNAARHIVDQDLSTFYQEILEAIERDEPILYLEFGVAQGMSISRMAQLYRHPDARFFGFDSFVGLPEDWLVHKKGAFSNEGSPPHVGDERIRFIHDDVVAMWDFTQAFPNQCRFLIQTRGGGSGPNPDQVFGRILRQEFRPNIDHTNA